MSAQPAEARDETRPAELVAGIMAAAALAVGVIAIVKWPVRLSPVAMIVALIAVGIGGRFSRLASVAVAVIAIGWVLGMIYVGIIQEDPLW